MAPPSPQHQDVLLMTIHQRPQHDFGIGQQLRKSWKKKNTKHQSWPKWNTNEISRWSPPIIVDVYFPQMNHQLSTQTLNKTVPIIIGRPVMFAPQKWPINFTINWMVQVCPILKKLPFSSVRELVFPKSDEQTCSAFFPDLLGYTECTPCHFQPEVNLPKSSAKIRCCAAEPLAYRWLVARPRNRNRCGSPGTAGGFGWNQAFHGNVRAMGNLIIKGVFNHWTILNQEIWGHHS